jgi:hypothetical protein
MDREKIEMEQILGEIEDLLPSTYYAAESLQKRIAYLVADWRRLHILFDEIEVALNLR